MTPYPLPDETYDCYFRRLLHLRCLGKALPNNFDFYRRNYPQNAYCDDRKIIDGVLFELGVIDHAVDLLGFVPFMRPFLPDDVLSGFFDGQHSPYSFRKRNNIERAFSAIVDDHRICPSCVEEDLDSHGVWYSRRIHALRPIVMCDKHLTPLLERCPRCNWFLRPSFGSSLPRCSECGLRIGPTCEHINRGIVDVEQQVRLLSIIQEILQLRVRGNLNCEQFLLRLGISKADEIPRLWLSRRISRMYGKEYLDRIYLNPHVPPRFGWPSIYLYGRWHGIHGSMELLLAGLVPRKERQGIWHESPQHFIRNRIRKMGRMDLALFKTLLSGKSKRRIAYETGMSEWAVGAIRGRFPGVVQRTKGARERRRLRLLRRRERSLAKRARDADVSTRPAT